MTFLVLKGIANVWRFSMSCHWIESESVHISYMTESDSPVGSKGVMDKIEGIPTIE